MNKFNIILCIGYLMLTGCQSLDKEFRVVMSEEEVKTSFDNVKDLLTGIYSHLPNGFTSVWGGTGAAMLASSTDESEYTYETNPIQYYNTGNWNSVNNPDMVWGDYYKAIREVNYFLLSTDEINLDPWKLNPSESSQSIYNRYLAEIKRWKHEARFLRAFYYFELIKRYGGVPLLNNSLTLDEDFSVVKRNTLEECVNFIVTECDAIKDHLPPSSGIPYVEAEDLGRATRYAALALKSRTLLYAASELFNNNSWASGYAHPELISLPTGNRSDRWKAASDAAKELINELEDKTLGEYPDIFLADNFKLPEVILCRRNGSSNDFERYNSPIGFESGLGGNTPSQNLVDAYEVIVDAGTTKDFDWNDPVLAKDPYANRDPRLRYTIVTNNSDFGNPSRKVEIWQGGFDAAPIANATKTGYYLRKYVQETLDIKQGNNGVHSWVIFRIPEIYLNYIEALNEWNPGNAEIATYYNKTRNRPGVGMPSLPAGLGQEQVRERIRREKRIEFAFEDHRMWDVRRWMIAEETLGANLRGVNVASKDKAFAYTPFILENRIFLPKMYLYPIPQSDINIDGSLIQNPLW